MTACLEIIQRIENDLEALKPRDIELGVLDIVMVCHDLDVRVESEGGLLCNLYQYCK
jgi:hypothetical protein